MTEQQAIGAIPGSDGVRFRVWAPEAARVEVVLDAGEGVYPLQREDGGYHVGVVRQAGVGSRYRYRLDGGPRAPDPASRSQPEGVHGPSEVVDPEAFAWTDAGWPGLDPDDLVIYELHVGTFTPAGTFDGAIERLDHLVRLGVTAIEVMPIAEFAGSRNWGYDGVALFAPEASYGGPEGFRRLVDAAHRAGLGVILDVVYNHLGPEGNYLPAVTGGRFFTSRHHTPWGDAVNYDGPDSAPVRDFVIQNALHWAREYRVDGLRLDATHAIVDDSPVHILREIADRLHALSPRRIVIAEDERHDPRLALPAAEGGYGLDGTWADDLHHQLRRLTAGDREGYFAKYGGTVAQVVDTLRRGWSFEPRAESLPPRAFVHCIQNHDQVGNRAMGDRLNHSVPLPVYRALSALLLLSPYTPLLWMGQEWAASSPFQYFTDHPEELGRQVTDGRRTEFRQFSAFTDPAARERIPDPQAEETFLRSRLRWDEIGRMPHAGMLALYRELLALRRGEPALRGRGRERFAAAALGDRGLALRRAAADGSAVLVVVALGEGVELDLRDRAETQPPRGRTWSLVLGTEEERFGGAGVAAPCDGALVALGSAGAIVLRA
ncbi:MAG TPA: malto-oligosyltrehalose trehalohydrolase [Gemmatimonadales bacterium]|nr:malto-oligosyltrehalose trehalohydrolase [Gemmatimonadales bacterium]